MTRTRRHTHSGKNSHTRGLHIVALFEGAKGLLVLLVGFGLLAYIHKDLHEAALLLVEHFHVNPASHYPRIFLDLSEHVHDTQLWGLAMAAAMYSIVRMVEAIGLWLKKTWAEWFAVLSGGIYIPIEVYEVTRGLTWPRVTVLVVNLGVVSYLLIVMFRDGNQNVT